MNQMEAFKWEQKRLAANAKDRDREKLSKDLLAEERRSRERQEADDAIKKQVRQEDQKRERELDELERLVVQQAGLAGKSPELTSLPKDLPTMEMVSDIAPSSTSLSASASGFPSSNSSEDVSAHNVTSHVALPQSVNATAPVSVSPSSPSASSSKIPSTRSDSSESIYAHIIRRLNALEGNSSLVARYIEEQAKVMRVMLTRVERGWDDWRLERQTEEHRRWEQEVCEGTRSTCLILDGRC